jgi:hypothetical protein
VNFFTGRLFTFKSSRICLWNCYRIKPNSPFPSTIDTDKSMKYFPSTIITFTIIFVWYIPMNSKYLLHLDILHNIHSNGKLTTTVIYLFDTCDFNFAIVNFPFLCSNIPLSPTYDVYISKVIRFARTCIWERFKTRPNTNKKLMLQGYNEFRLKSRFRKLYGRYNHGPYAEGIVSYPS